MCTNNGFILNILLKISIGEKSQKVTIYIYRSSEGGQIEPCTKSPIQLNNNKKLQTITNQYPQLQEIIVTLKFYLLVYIKRER